MQKKITILIFYITIFAINLLNSDTVIYAADDNFPLLEPLQINQPIPQNVLAILNQVENQNPEFPNLNVYIAGSERNDLMHYIYTDKNTGLITFINLTIPRSEMQRYLIEQKILGEPETALVKTRTEVLLSYPSRGINYVFNDYSGEIYAVQKYPVKSVASFTEEEGKNYQSESYIETLQKQLASQSDFATTSASPTPVVPDKSSTTGMVKLIISLILFVVISLVLFYMFIR